MFHIICKSLQGILYHRNFRIEKPDLNQNPFFYCFISVSSGSESLSNKGKLNFIKIYLVVCK